MTFCLSTFGQMLDDEGFYKAIRHFGKENRIGCVHFGGVKGTLEKSEEAFPDESKLDMLRAVKVLKEAGFDGIIEIDHAPHPIRRHRLRPYESRISNRLSEGDSTGSRRARMKQTLRANFEVTRIASLHKYY